MKKLSQHVVLTCILGILAIANVAFGESTFHNDSSNKAHCKWKNFKQAVEINITMTIPQLIGPIPEGGNLDITPFAIGPCGKLVKGTPTNIVPANAFIQSLNPIKINDPVQGNWITGYIITLGQTSPVFSFTTAANFSGVILNNPVGNKLQTITIPPQTLFLSSAATNADKLIVSANFPIIKKI